MNNLIMPEALEPRRLNSADISVGVHSGTLEIFNFKNEDVAATISVVDGRGFVRANGTINDASAAFKFNPAVITEVSVFFNDGNDALKFTGPVPGTMLLAGGHGNDRIAFDNAQISGQVTATGDHGDDTLSVVDSTFSRSLSFNGGYQRDRVYVSNSHINANFTIAKRSGPLIVNATGLTVGGRAVFSSTNSADHLTFADSTIASGFITTRGGNDTLTGPAAFFDHLSINLGTGTNQKIFT